MSASELETQINRFKVNEERLNTFVNVDGFYTTSSGVQVPTLLNVSKRIEASVENVSLAEQSASSEITRQTDLVIAASTSAQEEFLNEDSKINTLAKNTIADWQTAITTITQAEGVPALAVSTANNETQQSINDSVGAKWYAKGGGYPINYRVMLVNGDIVKSTVNGNANNPNVDMAGWVRVNSASQIFDESGLSQQAINNSQEAINSEQEAFNSKQIEINLGVNSINDLLNIDSLEDNDRIFVKSYHVGLNKGGGFFVYDSTRSLENDGGLVINGWIRTGFDSVNAFMFGAIGDGIADDTIAIQKAINTVNKLNIPTGAYLISAPIKILKSNVHITGDGASSILRQITDDIDTITIGKSDTDVQAITIENLFFTRSGSTDFGSAISCENTLNLTLRNLKTDGMAWSFVFKDKNFGPSVSDCNLYNHKIGGIWWNSTSLVSSGIPATNGLSLIRVNMDNILGVQPTIAGLFWQSGEGIYAVNCEFIRQKVGMLVKPEIPAMSGAHFGKFSNCLFDMCGEHGVMMFPQNGSNIRIISFTECWFSASGLEGVVLVPDATSEINSIGFTSCQFVTNGKGGLYLAGNANLTDVQVSGGFFLANSANTPNMYSGINNAGMGSGLIVNGITSHLGDSGYANNQKHGIEVALGSSNFIITSNYLKGNFSGGINDMSGSVSKVVNNNIL